MSQPPAGTDRLRIERLIPASVDEVYAAWTEPTVMARWLSPTGRAEVEAEARVGGRLRVVMIGEGVRIEHTGAFLQVDSPRRLSFTWSSPYTKEEASVVTVTLTPEGGATRLVLDHERLPAEAVGSHGEGWKAILERLAGVFGEAGRRDPA